jgi:hypothetical protein
MGGRRMGQVVVDEPYRVPRAPDLLHHLCDPLFPASLEHCPQVGSRPGATPELIREAGSIPIGCVTQMIRGVQEIAGINDDIHVGRLAPDDVQDFVDGSSRVATLRFWSESIALHTPTRRRLHRPARWRRSCAHRRS